MSLPLSSTELRNVSGLRAAPAKQEQQIKQTLPKNNYQSNQRSVEERQMTLEERVRIRLLGGPGAGPGTGTEETKRNGYSNNSHNHNEPSPLSTTYRINVPMSPLTPPPDLQDHRDDFRNEYDEKDESFYSSKYHENNRLPTLVRTNIAPVERSGHVELNQQHKGQSQDKININNDNKDESMESKGMIFFLIFIPGLNILYSAFKSHPSFDTATQVIKTLASLHGLAVLTSTGLHMMYTREQFDYVVDLFSTHPYYSQCNNLDNGGYTLVKAYTGYAHLASYSSLGGLAMMTLLLAQLCTGDILKDNTQMRFKRWWSFNKLLIVWGFALLLMSLACIGEGLRTGYVLSVPDLEIETGAQSCDYSSTWKGWDLYKAARMFVVVTLGPTLLSWIIWLILEGALM